MSKNEDMAMTRFEKLVAVAKNTKDSLFRCWTDNGESFIDKDKMKSPGVIAEASGLASLLLFLVAFNEEKGILSDEDCKTIREIHKKSFMKIYSWVENDGFTAEPLISKSETVEIFDNNASLGYVDTISWVLSSTILTRFLDRYHILTLDIDILQKNNELLTKSLGILINSQREDGTWGFLSDKKAYRSLYFTFVANAALADFFDYIMGEIALVTGDDSSLKIEKDQEMLDYLKKELQDENIEESIGKVREKIQDWLIYDCLPLMPELAQCNELSDEKRKKLGVWEDTKAGKYSNYYNLYYIYYLIEMMVTSSSDVRISELFGENGENTANIEAVKKYYKENGLMNSLDVRYYFDKTNILSLWKNVMEQSIHNSRSEYMSASRTGKQFWDSEDGDKSSLKIKWTYPEKTAMADEIEAIQSEIDKCIDPCIIPMALRSNIMYCYYISDQPDMTVDRLFENICAQIADADTDTELLFNGLWDNIKFSLTVTERCVEALVDYYDYLMKFDDSVKATVSGAVYEKSKIDVAVEERIFEFLLSEAGSELIRNSVSPASNDKQADISDEIFKEKFEKYIRTNDGIAAVRKALGSENIRDLTERVEDLENSKNEISTDVVIETIDKIIDILSFDDLGDNETYRNLVNRLVEASEQVRSLGMKKTIEKSLTAGNAGSAEEVYETLKSHLKGLGEYVIANYSTADPQLLPDLATLMQKLYIV